MLDHVSLPVTDLDRSVAFYTQALAPLGYRLMTRGDGYAGFECRGVPDLWLGVRGPSPSVHLAFRVDDEATVRAFHEAALQAGGVDHGAPGLRPYHPKYYAAFALDPDGHNVEAVFHG